MDLLLALRPLCDGGQSLFPAESVNLLLPVLMQGVSEVAALLLRDDYVTVNTVSEDERPSHEAIAQVGCNRLMFPSRRNAASWTMGGLCSSSRPHGM
jgi:hypothetical protein